jgi:ABC-type lipoprotein release transport system permease subunit
MLEISGVSPNDPIAIGLAMSALMACALVAVIAPARRAARMDPASLLRQN